MKADRFFHAAAATVLLSAAAVAGADPLVLADKPLFVKAGAAPNIFITLDDSGSMAQAYLPDDNSVGGTRRYMSPDWNTQFYDPSVTYVAPKKADGSSYETSFTQAWINGFAPDLNEDGLVGDTVDYIDLSARFMAELLYIPSARTVLEQLPNPALDYGPGGLVRPDTLATGDAAFYYKFDTSLCAEQTELTLEDDGCYRHIYVGSAADLAASDRSADASRQNFANWYSFYRTRVFSMASAATLAFEAVGPTTRLAFQTLNTACNAFSENCRGWKGDPVDSRLRPFTGVHRSDVYNWLAVAPADGGTPLRKAVVRAGAQLSMTGVDSAYADEPGTSLGDSPVECRASYHLIFTDGIWNGALGSAVGNVDGGSFTTPDGLLPPSTFNARRPFADSTANSLADIVFMQWATDAQPGLANKVEPFLPVKTGSDEEDYWNPVNDPASWQHMTTFTIGLGFADILSDPLFDGDTFGGDYDQLKNGTKNWPAVGGDNFLNNPYDLWHAAINGRGQFFNAVDPAGLVEAFQAVLEGVQDRTGTAVAPGASSSLVDGASRAFSVTFNTLGWSGDLQAFELSQEGDTLVPGSTALWSAASLLRERDWTGRNIRFSDASGALRPFRYASLSTEQQASLDRDSLGVADGAGDARVDWIRGNPALEVSRFRDRGQASQRRILGDIINSAPLYVGAPSLLGLDAPEGISVGSQDSYLNFAESRSGRRSMVYVGANDGMLHGFDADTGAEMFAFIPTEVLPELYKLSSLSYGHQSYVDGPLNTFDIRDPQSPDGWRTILVGGLRGGGKGVFALDVTNPGDGSGITRLWEVSGSQMLDGVKLDQLGYTWSKPQIARLHNGRWAVIIANGYKSDGDRAALYVIDALSGELIRHFDTGVGTPDDPNGLAEPLIVDVNGDLITDYVYAGDLHGNMWRFDLLDGDLSTREAIVGTTAEPSRRNALNPAEWKIAFSGAPLFSAVDGSGLRQPITSKPQLALHPFGDSYLVMFGTGKYLETQDAQPNDILVNSFYAIWDQTLLNADADNGTITRSRLQQQKLLRSETQIYESQTAESVNTQNVTIKRISSEPVDWYTYDDMPPFDAPVVNEQGWYLDFVEYADDGTGRATAAAPSNLGEMVYLDPVVRGGPGSQIVFFVSSTPNDSICESGLQNYVYGLDTLGAPPRLRQFDLNKDALLNDQDYNENDAAYGFGVNTLGAVKVLNVGGISLIGENILSATEGGVDVTRTRFGAADGRQTWRQLR